jgi:hypothetical protein
LFNAYVKKFEDNAVKIVFDNPCINGHPIKVAVGEDDGHGGYKGTVLRPAYKQPYILKLEALYDAECDKKIKPTPADAKKDVIIFQLVMNVDSCIVIRSP